VLANQDLTGVITLVCVGVCAFTRPTYLCERTRVCMHMCVVHLYSRCLCVCVFVCLCVSVGEGGYDVCS
jgi:hypothetical protein